MIADSVVPIEQADSAQARFEEQFGSVRRVDGNSHSLLCTAGETGFHRVLEDSEGVAVSFRGFLHDPVPQWSSPTRPSADADESARYLARRFRQLGAGFLDGVWGRFAVAIVDLESDFAIAATDPYGSLDVFHSEHEGRLVTASGTGALRAVQRSGLTLDRTLEDFLLVHGFLPPGRSLYRGVGKLQAATAVLARNGSCSTRAIDPGDPWPDLKCDWEDAEEPEVSAVLRDAFFRALEEQLPADDHVALLLGGFDSALVGAGLRELGKRVSTYSFFYGDARYNQANTDKVAAHLGAEHHWVEIHPGAVGEGLEHYWERFNTPTNWPNYVIQTAIVAERIRDDGFDHCFSGDGCDYLFFGYPLTYRRNRLIEQAAALPRPVLSAATATLARPSLEALLGRPHQVAMGVLRNARRSQPARSYLNFRIFDPVSLRTLRSGEAANDDAIEALAAEMARPHEGADPMRLAYLGKTRLAPYLIKMEGSSSATGVSITAPYLHKGMVDLARSIPERLLRPEGDASETIGKYALVRMAERHDLLPLEVIHQPKMGAVDAPVKDWYTGEISSTMTGLLEDLPFRADPRYLERLFSDRLAERAWARLISRDTSDVVSIDHGISLLATYASFARATR